MGGLNLLDLRTEIGIAQLNCFWDAVYSDSKTGKLLKLKCVKYMQLESGISAPLLKHPDIHISCFIKTWTTLLWHFLYQHNLTVSLTDKLEIIQKGKYNHCIMNPEALTQYTPAQQRDINLVRLFLQVITMSNMTTVVSPHDRTKFLATITHNKKSRHTRGQEKNTSPNNNKAYGTSTLRATFSVIPTSGKNPC